MDHILLMDYFHKMQKATKMDVAIQRVLKQTLKEQTRLFKKNVFFFCFPTQCSFAHSHTQCFCAEAA